MTPDRNDRITAALIAIDALRVQLIDLSSDVDIIHEEEVEAERVPDVNDPFNADAEGALLDAYNAIAAAIEQMETAGDNLETAKKAEIPEEDFAEEYFDLA